MKNQLLIICLFLSAFSYSQNSKISGRVVDSANTPIVAQIVTVINVKSNITYSFTRTNNLGEFSFEIDTSNKDLAIVVKSSFYKQVSVPIYSSYHQYKIILYQQIKNLSPVEVISSKPIVKKNGDTLRYNLNAFANNNDRVIADVLPKIPGVEVGANGIIKYNGMPISNFFIDGDNLLDKRYNILTNNISKDIVDEIQILENNQPIKVLQGMNIPNNAAMNITFKKGFKGKIIHNSILSAGIPNLVELNYNQVALKQKFKALNYLKYNNVGTDYLLEHNKQDLTELSKQAEINWEERLFSLNTVSPPQIQKYRYNLNSNFANSTNLLFKIKNDFFIKTNSFILTDAKQLNYNNRTEVFLPSVNISFKENQSSNTNPSVFYQEIVLNKNSTKSYINNEFTGELEHTKSTALLQTTTSLHEQLNEKNYRLRNEFKYIRKFSIGLLDITSTVEWNNNPQTLNLQNGILKNLLNDSLQYDETQQMANNNLLFIKHQITFSNVLKKIKYHLTLGNLNNHRNNRTNILLQKNGLFYEPMHIGLRNAITSTYATAFSSIGISYEHFKQKIDVEITPTIMSLKTKNTDASTNMYRRFVLNTSMNVKQQLGRESSIRLAYSYKDEPIEIGNIFENYYLQNYRFLYRNPLPFLPENKHSLYLNYNFQRSLQLFFANLVVSKSYTNMDYILTNEVKNDYSTSTYTYFKNNQSLFNATLNLSKYFFKLKSTLGVKINFLSRNYALLQNGSIAFYNSLSKGCTITFRPTITDFLQFNTDFSWYNISNGQNNQTVETPVIYKVGNVSSIDFLLSNHISFKLKHEILSYKNAAVSSSNINNFIDFSAKYSNKKKTMSYELKCFNLLNKQSYWIQLSDINFLQQSSFELRPLNVMLYTSIKL